MTRLAITALAALALAVPAATAAPVRQEAAPSIAAIAASSPQFSTLLSLVKKAGLAGTLSKPGDDVVEKDPLQLGRVLRQCVQRRLRHLGERCIRRCEDGIGAGLRQCAREAGLLDQRQQRRELRR